MPGCGHPDEKSLSAYIHIAVHIETTGHEDQNHSSTF